MLTTQLSISLIIALTRRDRHGEGDAGSESEISESRDRHIITQPSIKETSVTVRAVPDPSQKPDTLIRILSAQVEHRVAAPLSSEDSC